LEGSRAAARVPADNHAGDVVANQIFAQIDGAGARGNKRQRDRMPCLDSKAMQLFDAF